MLRRKHAEYSIGQVARAILKPYGPFDWHGVPLWALKRASPDKEKKGKPNIWEGAMHVGHINQAFKFYAVAVHNAFMAWQAYLMTQMLV